MTDNDVPVATSQNEDQDAERPSRGTPSRHTSLFSTQSKPLPFIYIRDIYRPRCAHVCLRRVAPTPLDTWRARVGAPRRTAVAGCALPSTRGRNVVAEPAGRHRRVPAADSPGVDHPRAPLRVIEDADSQPESTALRQSINADSARFVATVNADVGHDRRGWSLYHYLLPQRCCLANPCATTALLCTIAFQAVVHGTVRNYLASIGIGDAVLADLEARLTLDQRHVLSGPG